jgi:hypothetical protein
VPTLQSVGRSQRWWPLAALLLAGPSRWLVADMRPVAGATVSSAALGCAWALALLWVWPERAAAAGCWWKMLLAGAMAVGGPALWLLLPAPLVDAGGLTIALSLTPVVVAVACAAWSRGQTDDLAGGLWPGLAAVAGLLLVLVTPVLSDARTDAVLALSPLLTGAGAAWFCAQDGSSVWKMRWALLGALALFAADEAVRWAVFGRPVVQVAAVAWDGVLPLLSLLALARLGATRWAAQFVLLPLLVLLEGIVLVRPPVTLRWLSGLALLAVAGVYLLLPREEDQATG